MSLWTHNACDPCFEKKEPGRRPVRLTPEYTEQETCCFCGKQTKSGINYRYDPSEVDYCEHT